MTETGGKVFVHVNVSSLSKIEAKEVRVGQLVSESLLLLWYFSYCQ